jgi:arylsulfatase A-like enzyme
MNSWLLSPINIFLFLILTYHIIQAYITQGAGDYFQANAKHITRIVYSYITFFVFVALITTLTQDIRWLHVSSMLLLLLFFSLLDAYLFGAEHSFDYAVLKETGQQAFAPGTWDIIWTTLDKVPLKIGSLATLVFLGLEVKYHVISSTVLPHSLALKITLLLAYSVILILPLTTKDEVTYFFKSIVEYYLTFNAKRFTFKKDEYPLLKPEFNYSKNTPTFENKPDVFYVMIESLNASMINKKTESGEEITPYLNQLIKEGLYVDHFYGNSMMSIKGYTTLMSGISPPIRGSLLENQSHVNVYGLPHVFKENGYSTLFFQGQLHLDFHNTYKNMTQLGFEEGLTPKDYLTPDDQNYFCNIGHEDHVVYRTLFEHLNKNVLNKPNRKPLFLTMATIYSHFWFKNPPEKRHLYKDPKSVRENYINTIHMSDRDLKGLIENIRNHDDLKDAVVMISADHGFPIGEHGIEHAQAGFYDDSFRVPFLMLCPGKIKPERIEKKVYSQVDIAPTLIDLLNLKVGPHYFSGQSMFSPYKEKPTFLVQPFSGCYLSVVRYPYKYILHQRTKAEYLFNLEKDPGELNNIITSPPDCINSLKNDLNELYLNHEAICANKLIPKKNHA